MMLRKDNQKKKKDEYNERVRSGGKIKKIKEKGE